MDPHRTIVESEEFTEARRALGIHCQRLDEIMEGVCEVLARKPDEFPKVPNTAMRRVKTRPFPPEIFSFGIFFEYDERVVTLKYIYRVELLD